MRDRSNDPSHNEWTLFFINSYIGIKICFETPQWVIDGTRSERKRERERERELAILSYLLGGRLVCINVRNPCNLAVKINGKLFYKYLYTSQIILVYMIFIRLQLLIMAHIVCQ